MLVVPVGVVLAFLEFDFFVLAFFLPVLVSFCLLVFCSCELIRLFFLVSFATLVIPVGAVHVVTVSFAPVAVLAPHVAVAVFRICSR